jgi:hypothetical protein
VDLPAGRGGIAPRSELFRFTFKLEVPVAPIKIAPLGAARLGHYVCGFNEFGLKNEITIAASHVRRSVDGGQWWRVLGTLLHEHPHLWQQLHGKPGRWNYHNVEYQRKAEGVGLIVDSRGYTQYAAESPFMDLLKKHGVEVPEVPKPQSRVAGQSKLKKWSCGCTNIRAAVAHFRALCLNCNQNFTLGN